MEKLLETGSVRGHILIFYFVLLAGMILSTIIMVVGLVTKARKGSFVSIPDNSTRAKMVPLWLIQILLSILTIWVAILYFTCLNPAFNYSWFSTGPKECVFGHILTYHV